MKKEIKHISARRGSIQAIRLVDMKNRMADTVFILAKTLEGSL